MPARQAATIYSVAKEAGVSIATVSRVLGDTGRVAPETRRRVEEAATRQNYMPLASARSLAVKRAEAVGLVLPHLSGPYYSELLVGFTCTAADHGQSVVLMVAEPKQDPRTAVRRLASRVDGLVFVAKSAVTDGQVQALAADRPVLTVARHPVLGADAFLTENEQTARALSQHLLEHGSHRLKFVGDPTTSPDVRGRHQGFVTALRDAGVTAHPPAKVANLEAAGRAYADTVVNRVDSVDGFVCANDEIALAMMERFAEYGVRVPEDVAVVGWDDVMTSRYVHPGLTTVAQPIAELGALAATQLLARVRGDPPMSRPMVLATTLVIRQSCGCPPPPVPTRRPAPPDPPPESSSDSPAEFWAGSPVPSPVGSRTPTASP